ncbi:hypothetical protein SAMN06295967_111118 [Belliella buryatensis]|uniref:Uncharacterized protein n=1 Tax=Belliella buryatensis TaxID=1500549 RepID=A0A239F4V7_9BACT|nr:hypothetical protein [Belliella buryatensis]SNS51929.1 hypothetical protein SAMN06295967_111118 [Belliella buryatensis]
MKKLFLIILFLWQCPNLWAQENEWPEPIVIKQNRISAVSLDNQDFIMMANQEGDIYQYDRFGEFVNNFSPSRQGRIDFLEATWTVNIFTYSIDLQEYRILDRFLNPIAENRVQTKGINLGKAATLGNNNIIWIYDESDFSLKQFDHRRNQIIQQQPLNLILTNSDLMIQEIKEYQNLVFLRIKDEGISILDNQANLIKILPFNTNQPLAFRKQELIYVQNGLINFVDYINATPSSFANPKEVKNHAILISDKAVIFYNLSEILIYDKAFSPLNQR